MLIRCEREKKSITGYGKITTILLSSHSINPKGKRREPFDKSRAPRLLLDQSNMTAKITSIYGRLIGIRMKTIRRQIRVTGVISRFEVVEDGSATDGTRRMPGGVN
jgi:hypothetical protein